MTVSTYIPVAKIEGEQGITGFPVNSDGFLWASIPLVSTQKSSTTEYENVNDMPLNTADAQALLYHISISGLQTNAPNAGDGWRKGHVREWG